MKIVFILSLVSLLVFAVASVVKERKYSALVRYASCTVTVVFAVVAGIAERYLLPLGIGVGIFAAVSMGLMLVVGRIKSESLQKFVGYMAKAILFVLLIEAVAFNFNSYHLWKGGYEETGMNLSAANITGMTQDGDKFVSSGDTASIEFGGLNQKVGVIKLDLTGTKDKTDYTVEYADETKSSYNLRVGEKLPEGSVYNDIEATKYIVCDFSGAVSSLRINLTGLSENQVTLSGVTLNADYPASFSYLRFALILLGIAFVWAFKRSANFRKPLGNQLRNTKAVTAVLIIIVVILSYVLSSVNLDFNTDFNRDSGDQVTQELVDILGSGKTSYDEQPSDQLLAMENPYDYTARTSQNVSAKWDHVLYDGKYYSYYGVGPVILLYLPFHQLTGHYLAPLVGVWLMNTIALIFLGMTFFKLMKKLFPDIPLSMYTAALAMIFAACGVWYCMMMAQFYEIAQSFGFCFTILGAYFLVSSNVIGSEKEKIRVIPAALSSLFLAIAVTCRPTTAIWCVVAAAFIAAGVLKLRRTKSPASGYVKYLLCALVPFVVIGGLQMLYNHARFGSFTDFGIAYSLTINDFTHTEFHTQLSAICFFDYLLAPPSFTGEFPYVSSTLSTLGANGYFFVATENGCGLLFRCLPMFFLFGSPFALKYVKKERRVRTAILFSLVAFVAPFIVIASIWESGYGARYMMDFAWEMLVCAFLVMFLFYRNLKTKEAKKIYEHLLLIAMFACLFVNMGLTYDYCTRVQEAYLNTSAAAFENFGRMFGIFNT